MCVFMCWLHVHFSLLLSALSFHRWIVIMLHTRPCKINIATLLSSLCMWVCVCMLDWLWDISPERLVFWILILIYSFASRHMHICVHCTVLLYYSLKEFLLARQKWKQYLFLPFFIMLRFFIMLVKQQVMSDAKRHAFFIRVRILKAM